MSLMTNNYVKSHFVQYHDYFIDEDGVYDESILTDEIANSETILNEYVDVDETTITDQLKLHLLNIIRYRGFTRKHGDREFDNKPQIVRDYEASITVLEELKAGIRTLTARPVSNDDAVTMTSKPRKFGNADGSRNWFT